MSRPALTDDTVRFLRRYYATRGPEWCAQKLGIHLQTTYKWARACQANLIEPDGYISTLEAASLCGHIAESSLKSAARQAGIPVHGHQTIGKFVPRAWAIEYARESQQRKHVQALLADGRLTATQAARRLKLDPGTLRLALRDPNPALPELLERLAPVIAPGRTPLYAFEPARVDAYARHLASLKRDLQPMKALWSNGKHAGGRAYERARPLGIVLQHNGRRLLFVPREAA